MDINTLKLGIVVVGIFIISFILEAKSMDEYQGLKIELDTNTFKQTGKVQINGQLSIFVNCGSQYATWFQFPQTILYILKDLDTGEVFKSVDTELSISWDGDQVYDTYAKEPCDRVVTEEFTAVLSNIYFKNPSKNTIANFELQASYLGHSSNSLIIQNASVVLNGW